MDGSAMERCELCPPVVILEYMYQHWSIYKFNRQLGSIHLLQTALQKDASITVPYSHTLNKQRNENMSMFHPEFTGKEK